MLKKFRWSPVAPLPPSLGQAYTRQSYRVLIVDSNPLMRRVLSQALSRRCACEVRCYYGARVALEETALLGWQPDAVLVALDLPGAVQVMRRFRHACPVIAMAPPAFSWRRVQARLLGALACFTPLDLDWVLGVILTRARRHPLGKSA